MLLDRQINRERGKDGGERDGVGGSQTNRESGRVGGLRARGRERDRQSNQEKWRRKDGKGERATD